LLPTAAAAAAAAGCGRRRRQRDVPERELGRRREKRRLDEDWPIGHSRPRGWRRTRGVNYCRFIRRSLPIVVDSSVSPVARRLALAAVESLVASPRLPLRPPSRVVQVGGVDSMQRRLRGCPLKGRPKGKTFGRESFEQTRSRRDRTRSAQPARGMLARIAAKVTSRPTANVGVYHSERR